MVWFQFIRLRFMDSLSEITIASLTVALWRNRYRPYQKFLYCAKEACFTRPEGSELFRGIKAGCTKAAPKVLHYSWSTFISLPVYFQNVTWLQISVSCLDTLRRGDENPFGEVTEILLRCEKLVDVQVEVEARRSVNVIHKSPSVVQKVKAKQARFIASFLNTLQLEVEPALEAKLGRAVEFETG